MEPQQDVVWQTFTYRRAFPVSSTLSAGLHLMVIAAVLSGVITWLSRSGNEFVEFEPVVVVGPRGGGDSGSDERTALGTSPVTADQFQVVETNRRPIPRVTAQPELEPTVSEASPSTREIPDTDLLAGRLQKLSPLPNLQAAVRGLPTAPKGRGGVAAGAGDGKGQGEGAGDGDGPGGRLTTKQKRQLRWHLIFNISHAADYLDQLHRMKAIVGFQLADRSIHLITDLRRRPAVLQPTTQIPDRIFWMDDDPESIRTICEELRLSVSPTRVIAFFPESIEEELLRKEQAYGKRFGRVHEDDFVETTFRVTNDYGRIDISVIRQVGRP